MKILKTIVIILVCIVAVILVVAILLPNERHMEASLTINAPAKVIFEQVNDFKNWDKWSPFKEEDTAMISTYSGAPKGEGAIMSWVSTEQGNGVLTILEVEKYKMIHTQIDFEGQGSSFSDWTFAEDSSKSTKVTWALDLKNLNYPIGRLMGFFMNFMITKRFDKGLANLKKVSEEYDKLLNTYTTSDMKIKQTEKQYAIVIKDSSTCDEVDMLMSKVYGDLGRFIGENKVEITGYPFAICYLWDEKGNKYVADMGFYIKNKVEGKDNVRCIEVPAQKVVSAIHNGAYESSGYTHVALDSYIKDNKLTCIGPPTEIYLTEPGKEPDMTKWKTEIIYPVK